MKIAVVFNPRSGNAPSEDELRAAFRGLGVQVQTVPMDDQCEERLRIAARACDIFAAAGGDGTINAVAQALVDSGSGAALGVLPTGTANDLCRTLEIPSVLTESAAVVVRGRSAALDVIEMDGGRIMVNQANGGFGGEVAQQLEEGTKSRWGPLGYWRASVEAAQELPEFDLRLAVDGERLEVRALNMTVANARYSGGGIALAPLAEYDDGEMDIVIIEARDTLGLLSLIPHVMTGSHIDVDGVVYRRARMMQVWARPAMPFSIDGEIGAEHTARFDVRPGRLRVRVPA